MKWKVEMFLKNLWNFSDNLASAININKICLERVHGNLQEAVGSDVVSSPGNQPAVTSVNSDNIVSCTKSYVQELVVSGRLQKYKTRGFPLTDFLKTNW